MTEESPDAKSRRKPRARDLHVRVTQDGLDAIDAIADEEHRTRSDMARVLLLDAVTAWQKRKPR